MSFASCACDRRVFNSCGWCASTFSPEQRSASANHSAFDRVDLFVERSIVFAALVAQPLEEILEPADFLVKITDVVLNQHGTNGEIQILVQFDGRVCRVSSSFAAEYLLDF